MCYDVKSSLTSWSIAVAIAIYLYIRNRNYDRWNSGFIIAFTTIQLVEAGLWSTDNKGLNSLLTRLVLMVLLFQPFVQTYLGAQATKNTFLHIGSYIFLGIIIYGLLASTNKNLRSNVGKNGHLVWHLEGMMGGVVGILYLLGLFVPLLFMKEGRGLPLLITGLITAAFSASKAGTGEFSSLWCYYSVIYSVVAVFV